jgi:hypothetical protein
MNGSVSTAAPTTLALDDEQARRARLLLLGKAAVLALWFDHRLTAGLDDGSAADTSPPRPAPPISRESVWRDGMPQSTKRVGERELAPNAGEDPS